MNTQVPKSTLVRTEGRSRIALASLVLGVTSVLLGLAVVSGFFGLFVGFAILLAPWFGIVAVISAIMALSRIRKNQLKGKWLAIIGLVLGALTTAFWLVIFLGLMVGRHFM